MEVIQIREDGAYTPIVAYHRGEQSVIAVGLVHLGEEEYYKTLQQRIDDIPFGFFEYIELKKKSSKLSKEREHILRELERECALQWRTFGNYTGVMFQNDILQMPIEWETIESTIEGIYSLQFTSELKKLLKAEKQEHHKIEKSYQDNPSLARHHLLSSLTEANGEEKCCYRDHRLINAVFKVLEEGRNTIGVAYGARHLHPLDRFLTRIGFEQTNLEWLCAVKR